MILFSFVKGINIYIKKFRLDEKVAPTEGENFEKLGLILSEIHTGITDKSATPRRYLAFVNTCIRLYSEKRKANIERAKGLQVSAVYLERMIEI